MLFELGACERGEQLNFYSLKLNVSCVSQR